MSDAQKQAMNGRMATVRNLSSNETRLMMQKTLYLIQVRLKMLSSMDTVLDVVESPMMVDKAIQASATVTANADQMPISNQVKSIGIIEFDRSFLFHSRKKVPVS